MFWPDPAYGSVIPASRCWEARGRVAARPVPTAEEIADMYLALRKAPEQASGLHLHLTAHATLILGPAWRHCTSSPI